MTGNGMRLRLAAEPFSQYESGVGSPGSACGPATMAALSEYWRVRGFGRLPGAAAGSSKAGLINYMYNRYGGRPWGMGARRLARGLDKLINEAGYGPEGGGAASIFNNFERYRREIEAGRPVAVKFDRWLKLRWRGQYAFDYHWVLGIGWQEAAEGGRPSLIVQDNGGRTPGGLALPGRERTIDYESNRPVLTMVSFCPPNLNSL